MLTKEIGEYVVYYREGMDPTEEFVAQHHLASNTLMNFWANVWIQTKANCTNVPELVEKMEAFEKTVSSQLR
jgi:hypothetical protein